VGGGVSCICGILVISTLVWGTNTKLDVGIDVDGGVIETRRGLLMLSHSLVPSTHTFRARWFRNSIQTLQIHVATLHDGNAPGVVVFSRSW
jgi:hypothetical protein